MKESWIVNAILSYLQSRGLTVATEVANFHRSVDILALNDNGELWAIECKVSDMKRAIAQSKTHLLSADRVFIATKHKKLREETIKRIRDAELGLVYVLDDESIRIRLSGKRKTTPWSRSRNRLLQRLRCN